MKRVAFSLPALYSLNYELKVMETFRFMRDEMQFHNEQTKKKYKCFSLENAEVGQSKAASPDWKSPR